MKLLKTTIDGLKIGMFVSKLDRPWIKTPFLLEGLKINSNDDIEQLRKVCNYVYVDVEQGPTPDMEHWIVGDKKTYQQAKPKESSDNKAKYLPPKKSNYYEGLRRNTYVDRTKMTDELKHAEKACEQLGNEYKNVIEDLQKGRNIDIDAVKKGVTHMVDSMIRNPAASVWLIQVRRHSEYNYSRALGSSVWCAMFGRHLGLELDAINELALGGLLLDIGNVKISSSILGKREQLNDEEWKVIKNHVNAGLQIALHNAKGTMPLEVTQMIATHHERFDGSGYPQGLENEKIPLYGKIAGIADTFDAMTSQKPYTDKEPLSSHQAIAELYKHRDTLFQAELIEQFIQAVGIYPTGTLVELNTGDVGAVISVNGLRKLRPTIMLILDKHKKPMNPFRHIDLAKLPMTVAIKRGVNPDTFGIDMAELFL